MYSRRRFLSTLFYGSTGLLASQLFRSSGQAQPSTVRPQFELPPRGAVRVVVTSDLNGRYGSTVYAPEVHQAIKLIQNWQPDLVLCGGDMVAGQSKQLSDPQFQSMWQAFDQTVTQPLKGSKIPFAFTLGNHDGSGYQSSPGTYVFGRDRDFAQRYWNSIEPDCGLTFIDRTHFPFYYSFKQDNIFYLVWDATTASLSPTQLRWVENSLAAAQDASLRIVIGHLPLYAVAARKNKPGEILNDADKLFSLLSRYRVHTYISGHHHAYYPGRKGELNFLYAGALGGGPRQLIGSNQAPFKSLSVVDIDPVEQVTQYSTVNLKTMQIVDHQTLPSTITGVNGTIFRQR